MTFVIPELNTLDSTTKKRETVKALFRLFFKDDDGNPFELVDGQADIAICIVYKQHTRNQIITTTQYGKSETVSSTSIIF